MFKNLTIAAMALVTVSAFGQYGSTTKKYNDIDVDNMSMYQQRKAVEWRGNQCLTGADQFDLAETLDRAPMSVEKALLSGLSKAHRQSVMIFDQMIAYRFPDTTITTSTTSTDGLTATTTTTTTTSWDNRSVLNAMDWSGQEASFRPMRLVMASPSKSKEISYDQAIDILCSDQGSTSAAILQNWWMNKATEHEKDIVVRLLEDDASLADAPVYASVYTHRHYDWIN